MYQIIMQHASCGFYVPDDQLLTQWARHALKTQSDALPQGDIEVTIRIVDRDEISELNNRYRHKLGPTNILSFAFDMPEEIISEITILGDLVICAEIIEHEAKSQGKEINAHWAHMIIHGILHLLRYDHEQEADAIIMETKEITILNELGFSNPYYIGE
jgi:probable rRNA maturation factor